MEPHAAGNTFARELESALCDVLERLGKPAQVTAVRAALPADLQAPPQELRRVLDVLVTRGKLFAVGTARARFYSETDPSEVAARVVVAAVRERARSKVELAKIVKAELPWLGKIDPVIAQLLAAGKIFAHPQLRQGLPTKAIAKYAREPAPSLPPERFLDETVRALQKAVRKAEPHGISIRVLLDELRRRFERQIVGGVDAAASTASSADVQRTFAALQALSAREPGAGLLSLRQLRASLDLEKSRFDSAVLALAQQGRVILHHHDFPGSLSEGERDKLVVDANGTHFVGIALGAAS